MFSCFNLSSFFIAASQQEKKKNEELKLKLTKPDNKK
jgi:hypothetical protein